MNVVITGQHYAITAALRYIKRAFIKLGHNVVSAGSYNGVAMPWQGCNLVSPKYDFRPDIVLPQGQYFPVSFVESKLAFTPDLWLDVNAGQWLSGKPKNGVRATFLTDPHVISGIYNQIHGDYQYIFNPQKSYWLNVPNQYLMPYAADDEWYKPLDVEKTLDASLVGNIYADRVTLFNELNSRGYKTYLGLGLSQDDANLLYNQSKIGINWSSMLDITARVFELSSTGIIPLLNRIPFLSDYFVEDEDYIGFADMNEALHKIKTVIDNYDNYKQIGINARNKVVNGKHFWTNRVQQMLEIMKL